MKAQCKTTLDNVQCVGEIGHPGWCLFGDHERMNADGSGYFMFPAASVIPLAAMFDSVFPEGLSEMYGVPDDPIKSALPPIDKSADWSAKDRQIEWVRANFTPGMLAKLYKLSYDVDGLRRDACDGVIRKEK